MPTSTTHHTTHRLWPLVLTAAAVLLITMGVRQSLGLFVSPLNTATGLGLVNISFALAVGQFAWGASQPLFGIVADRYGPGRVIVLGGLLMALGLATAPLASSTFALTLTLGIATAAGAGAGSFSILIGATAKHIPVHKHSTAAGVINAGGSMGQFLFAPLTQALISTWGWVSALYTLAASTLLTLPMAAALRGKKAKATEHSAATTTATLTLRQQLRIAFADRSYWCLHAGFFTCGFHIAFLVTHLPSEVALCGLTTSVASTSLAIIGLANIAGSLWVGHMGTIYRMKWLLFWMYFSRAAAIAIYLLAPKEPLTFYLFAAALGFTWLSTVPPTAGLVGKLFGTQYLATLFGMTLLTHQIGGFFGAWLGGIAVVSTGSYAWMWWADIALALGAAVVNVPIRESHP